MYVPARTHTSLQLWCLFPFLPFYSSFSRLFVLNHSLTLISPSLLFLLRVSSSRQWLQSTTTENLVSENHSLAPFLHQQKVSELNNSLCVHTPAFSTQPQCKPICRSIQIPDVVCQLTAYTSLYRQVSVECRPNWMYASTKVIEVWVYSISFFCNMVHIVSLNKKVPAKNHE